MPPPTKIFSTHTLHPEVTRDLDALGDLSIAASPTPDAIYDGSRGAEIIIVRAPIDPQIIRRETGLKALVRHGAGLDMIPVSVATECGSLVANVPGANATTVAEHIIWTALALLRRNTLVNSDLRETGWEAGRQHSNSGQELSGKTVGIVGFGNVGASLANTARHGFSTPLLVHTRSPEKVPTGITTVSLETLLKDSDIIVLCCPLNEQTHGLLNQKSINLMKSGAILINVSRGPVVEEAPLIDALKTKHLSGAALDVFDTQPLPQDHPYLSLDNLILTPHMAGITQESMLRMGQGVVQEVQRILAGDLPKNFCNPEVEPAYRRRFS